MNTARQRMALAISKNRTNDATDHTVTGISIVTIGFPEFQIQYFYMLTSSKAKIFTDLQPIEQSKIATDGHEAKIFRPIELFKTSYLKIFSSCKLSRVDVEG
uniref:Uncharacterized protein n=1 Tax=Ceratitis capitata TaxID=7213 RepID=W8C897_CERCA